MCLMPDHKSEQKLWRYIVNGKTEVLTVNQWLKSLLSCMVMERLLYSAQSHPQRFLNGHFIHYVCICFAFCVTLMCIFKLITFSLICKPFICYVWNIHTRCLKCNILQKYCNFTCNLIWWLEALIPLYTREPFFGGCSVQHSISCCYAM